MQGTRHEQLDTEADGTKFGDAHPERKPFKHLMEDDHHEEDSVEGIAGYDERDTDN